MSAVRERGRERSLVAEARALRDRCARGANLDISTAPTPKPRTIDEARAQRRELYVLLGVCAEQIVDDFIASVPPSEVPPVVWVSPGMTVAAIFTDLLQRTLDRFFAEHANQWRDGGRTTPIEALLARIDQLGPQASGILDRPCFHYAEHLLLAGMRTITPLAPGVMSAIIELADRAGMSTTADEIVKIARRSVRVPAQLAALSLRRSAEVQDRLIDAETLELNLSAVRLTGGRGRERLEVDLLGVAIDPAAKGKLPPAYDYTIGCPSLLRLGSASALERFWTWTVELAEESGYLATRVR